MSFAKGESQLPIDVEKSKKLLDDIRSIAKQCYRNAVLTAVSTGGTYVEGFVVIRHGIAIEHGWNEIDGSIVDVTLALFEDTPENHYFPAVRYTADEAVELSQTKTLPFMSRTDDDVKLAAENAWAYVESMRGRYGDD